MIKKDQKGKQEMNTEIYLKKIKIKRENLEETHTVIKKQRLKEYQENYRESKKSQSNN